MKKGRAAYIGGLPALAITSCALADPRIYLDHAATTPVMPEAGAAMADALADWANPSSPHREGRAARATLEKARTEIASALDWRHDVILTSGASEALQIALSDRRRPVLASAVEHDAVFRAAPAAEVLKVGADGVVDRQRLNEWLRNHPGGRVAIQHVNSETGVIQSIDELAAEVRANGGTIVCDCSQSAGKLPLPDADLIAFSAHKFGGPPGVGALLVKDLSLLSPTGGQEKGYRAGTQNLPGVAGMAAALGCRREWVKPILPAIEKLERDLREGGAAIHPEGACRLPTILAVTMPGVTSEAQLVQFDLAGVAVSAGSACSSGSMKKSRVLDAFAIPPAEAACTIRISIGWTTTEIELQQFVQLWKAIAERARARAA